MYWIDATQSPPDTTDELLVVVVLSDGDSIVDRSVERGYYHTPSRTWDVRGIPMALDFECVSHWMPMPDLPGLEVA